MRERGRARSLQPTSSPIVAHRAVHVFWPPSGILFLCLGAGMVCYNHVPRQSRLVCREAHHSSPLQESTTVPSSRKIVGLGSRRRRSSSSLEQLAAIW
ncbi:hypothetical protein SESBI_47396 [Sesbania bispinosa]|nr:hypothetical protein SESBI_47396 [Sesbania bispinosa]